MRRAVIHHVDQTQRMNSYLIKILYELNDTDTVHESFHLLNGNYLDSMCKRTVVNTQQNQRL